jgi:hypothetical protein
MVENLFARHRINRADAFLRQPVEKAPDVVGVRRARVFA